MQKPSSRSIAPAQGGWARGISKAHLLPSSPGLLMSLLQLNAKLVVAPVFLIPSLAGLVSNKPWAVCLVFCKAEGVASRGC